MSNNYNNSGEETILDQGMGSKSSNNVANGTETTNADTKDSKAKAKPKKDAGWKKVAMGAGAGFVLGVGATVLTSGALPDEEEVDTDDIQDEDASDYSPLFDGEISMATGVSDDMSFSQAFAEAREEVGPGGVFEWHGNLYNTYTAEEWDNMSPQEHSEYASHFSWSSAQEDDPVQLASADGEYGYEPEVEILGVEHDNETGMNIGAVAIDGQEVILADVTGDGSFNLAWVDENGDGYMQDNEVQNISGEGLTVEDLGGVDPASAQMAQASYEPEVEVLGVEHDNETGMNFGEIAIDGQDVLLADVTGDGTFNLAAVDLNGDGYIQENEVQDISDAGLTMNDLLDNPMDGADFYATSMDSGFDPDYTNDADVSEYLA